jgi:uncharacterized membrane protein YeaQ/YmgE (transglycosylase-associated protein family)
VGAGEVTDTANLRRRSSVVAWLKRRRRRLFVIALIVAGIVGAFVLGLENTRRELRDSKQLLLQLQSESQKLREQIADQNSKLINQQSTLTKLASTLNELMPSKDTYQIAANQSLIVANGRMTVGIVGAPTNQSITVNINGRPQVLASGDVVEVAVNPQTTCHVRLQAFDMFKALITATCP